MIPITQQSVANLFPKRSRESHKYTNGYLISVVGSRTYPGAARLSTLASATVGAGAVQALIPASLWPLVGAFSPEIIPVLLPETHEGDINPIASFEVFSNLIDRSRALLIGSGMGRSLGSLNLIEAILSHSNLPTVIDGDGLFALGKIGKTKIKQFSSGNWILTPHAGELKRLLTDLEFDSVENLCAVLNLTILSKGFPSVLYSFTGEKYQSTNGNPAATTAGCGDVLAGIIAGYLAQGLKPQDAAQLGIYMAGAASDKYVKETKSHTLLASDIIKNLREQKS